MFGGPSTSVIFTIDLRSAIKTDYPSFYASVFVILFGFNDGTSWSNLRLACV